MRTRRWMTWPLAPTIAALAAGLVPAAPASAGTASLVGAGPAMVRAAAVRSAPVVSDVTPARSSKRGLAAPPVTSIMAAANRRKQAAARRLLLRLERRRPGVSCVAVACRAGLPAARFLAGSQQAQWRDYYCGPATVAEMLRQLGSQVSQAYAARELGTTSAGTNWSDASGYPVPRVLNAHQTRNQYVAVSLPWTPAGTQVATFEMDLVTDLNRNGGVPLAGNAYEVAGGPHLVGNPVNQTIMHWIDIRGYQDYGAVTDYEDSVHNATSIGWALNVPAYSALPTGTMVDILGARGYDW